MQEVAANIKRLTDIGKTVFIITHDPELILSCCNYVVFMERGQMSESYPLDENGAIRMLQFFQNI